MGFNKIFRKNMTYDDIKSDEKTKLYTLLSIFFWNIFLGLSVKLWQNLKVQFSWSTHHSDRLHDFSVTIPRCCKDVYVNSFFPCTARLWNSLPIECFPLTYDLNGYNLLWFLSKEISCILLSFCASFSCNTMPCSSCSVLHGIDPN